MPEEKTGSASDQAGSSKETQQTGPTNPNEIGGKVGEPGQKLDAEKGAGIEAQYKELETKLGTQGKELGELRNVYKGLSPLLDKLDEQPELVQLIMEGKITPDMVQAVSEGKIDPAEAAKVTEAHEEVKKDLGKKEYDKAKPEDIEKLVVTQVEKATKEATDKIQKGVDEREDIKNFEDKLARFVADTPDFAEYAEAIEKWFTEHPSQSEIAIAYDAVKGKALVEKKKEDDSTTEAERAKDLAANAGGGASRSSAVIKDTKLIDQLVAGKSNPNTF